MLRRFLAAAALVACAVPSVHAQATFRVGYVDTDQVVLRMPAFAEVQAQLRTQQQTVAGRVRTIQDSLGTVLQTRAEDYQNYDASALATADGRRQRETEIRQIQAQIEGAEQQGYQFLSYAESRLLQPVLQQVDEAITAEAQAQTLDLVLPTVANNAPVFLYASDRVVDITESVMRRLGIDPAAAPVTQQSGTPGSGPPPPGRN